MSETTVTSEDEVLLYTRGKRIELATALTVDGAPKNKEDQTVLLATLDGLDRQALGVKRIKVEEQQARNVEGQAALVAAVLTSIDPRTAMRLQHNRDLTTMVLPASIPEPILVEGELAETPGTMHYDEFMKKFEDD